MAASSDDLDALVEDIVLEQGVGALAELPLAVEHEAAAERVYFVVEAHACVALSSLDILRAAVLDPLPTDYVPDESALDHFSACIEVETSNQVHAHVTRVGLGLTSQSCTLPGRWQPLAFLGSRDFNKRLIVLLLCE